MAQELIPVKYWLSLFLKGLNFMMIARLQSHILGHASQSRVSASLSHQSFVPGGNAGIVASSN